MFTKQTDTYGAWIDKAMVHVKDGKAERKEHPEENSLALLELNKQELVSAKEQLFACEKTALDDIDGRLQKLNSKIKIHQLGHHGKYLPFDHSVLDWRDSKGYPPMVLFDLNSPEYMVKASVFSHVTEVVPPLPEKLAVHYKDFYERLRALTRRNHSTVHVNATFAGVIPASTRAKIVEATKVFDSIFILAETKLNVVENLHPRPSPLRLGDPIVLGWDKNQLWYVDDFDLTPLEEAGLLVGPKNP